MPIPINGIYKDYFLQWFLMYIYLIIVDMDIFC